MGHGWWRGLGLGVFFWQSSGTRLTISLGKHATLFQVEVYAISACVYKIQTQDRPEKYVSICCDSQVAMKALHAAKMPPLVHQCQKALNDTSTQHTMGLYWVPGHAGVRGNEISDKLARCSSIQKCIGPELSLGVSRQNIRNINVGGQPAFSNVVRSLLPSETGSKIGFEP